jgi:hypothetical protein
MRIPDRAEHTAKRISMVRIRVGADDDRKTTPRTGDNRRNATPDDRRGLMVPYDRIGRRNFLEVSCPVRIPNNCSYIPNNCEVLSDACPCGRCAGVRFFAGP